MPLAKLSVQRETERESRRIFLMFPGPEFQLYAHTYTHTLR